LAIAADVAARLRGASSVAVLTGAGLGAESGIPTFRGPEGWWRNHAPQQLATPEAFDADPQLVWSWYQHRRRIVAGAHPNAAHDALVELAALRPGVTLITQNVDRLLQRAGAADVIELHGNIVESRCFRCGAPAGAVGIESDDLVPCAACGGWLRPCVVWFGESLPREDLARAVEAARSCAVFLCVGTSGVVHPAAGLPAEARRAGAFVVEVNLEETPLSGVANVTLLGKCGNVLPSIVSLLRG